MTTPLEGLLTLPKLATLTQSLKMAHRNHTRSMLTCCSLNVTEIVRNFEQLSNSICRYINFRLPHAVLQSCLQMELSQDHNSLRLRSVKKMQNESAVLPNAELQDEAEPLSPASLMFHEPDFNVHIIAILGSKTNIVPDIVKSNLGHTLLRHPRFSSIQIIDPIDGKMKWVRTEVNLDDHVLIPIIDANVSPDKFVEDYVTNLTKTSVDKSKPLWDLHLLNVKTLNAEATGVFRIHHSMGDGASLMSLLLACTRQIAKPEALPTIPEPRKKTKCRNGFGGWLWNGLKMVWNTFVDVLNFMCTAFFLKDTVTPVMGLPGVEFTPRRFVYRTVSLDDMKLIKNYFNATINDVALGMTEAGLSYYLNRKYGELQKQDCGTSEKRNNLPKKIRLRSTLLINLRPAGIKDLADVMKNKTESKWGNWIGYVLLPFTIALRDDPLEYVKVAKATVDRKKNSFEAYVTFAMAELVLKFLGTKVAGKLSHNVISRTTLCFSNLVGPMEEIEFYGHPIAYLAPGSYGQPHGLMINFQSYMDKMTVVLSVDECTVPDAEKLCDEMEQSLKLMKDAVLAKCSTM